jgi:hypothetical protein
MDTKKDKADLRAGKRFDNELEMRDENSVVFLLSF